MNNKPKQLNRLALKERFPTRSIRLVLQIRAGAAAAAAKDDTNDDDDDLFLEDEEEEEEETEVEKKDKVKQVATPTSSKTTIIKAAFKSKAKQDALTNAAVKASIKATKTELQSSLDKSKEKKSSAATRTKKRQSSSILKKIPYIVRATLNPWIFFSMTRFYFASLFNINFLQEQPILRSAMQEQVRKSGGSGSTGKKSRTMRPGQAKTLSDLPQLSS